MMLLHTNNLSSVVRRPPSDRPIAFFLALLLFGVYLLSFNGRITSSDGLSMFAVTESFVKRGDVSTDQMWTFFGTKSITAPDGEVYSKYGYGTSLLAAPLYALALYTGIGGLMQTTLLSSALAIAITGALVYLTARRLNFSAAVGVSVALLFGLATPAWVYAKELWSEPFAALTLFAAFYFLLRYRAEWKTRDALCAGILLGSAIAVRTTNVILVPLYVWYARFPSNQIRRQNNGVAKKQGAELKIDWRSLFSFLVPIFFFVLSIFLYNSIRFQNPFTTGYRADEDFSNNILLGAYGLLFSPGKGLFVYAPFFAALPFGVWQFYKQHTRELFFTVSLFTVHCLLFSAWYYWWGGTNWAARFLVPTLPFLVLLCAPLIQLLVKPPPNVPRFSLLVSRFAFAVLILISFLNELAGVAVNSLTYRLRVINLSANGDWDSIFSPMFSPLIGHWQILKATNLDVAWMRATPDAMQIDWVVIGLTLFFIAWCTIRLVRMLLGYTTSWQRSLLALGLGVIVVVVLLLRYADDPRLGGNAGYAELLQTVRAEANADDVLILNDDAHARFFFNANRAPLKWYGLSRDPARWDEMTQRVIAEKIAPYRRVWFAFDDSVDTPNPMRDWFEKNLNATRRFEFENGVGLVLYETR